MKNFISAIVILAIVALALTGCAGTKQQSSQEMIALLDGQVKIANSLGELTTAIKEQKNQGTETEVEAAEESAQKPITVADVAAVNGPAKKTKTTEERLTALETWQKTADKRVSTLESEMRSVEDIVRSVDNQKLAAANKIKVGYFEVGSSKMDNDIENQTAAAAAIIKKCYEAKAEADGECQLAVRVVGYADKTGSEKRNKALSADRAKNVAQKLLGELGGVDEVEYIGEGEKTDAKALRHNRYALIHFEFVEVKAAEDGN